VIGPAGLCPIACAFSEASLPDRLSDIPGKR
jgi:hypothetical protein